jgi:Ca2+-binding RTX toxin-like protein
VRAERLDRRWADHWGCIVRIRSLGLALAIALVGTSLVGGAPDRVRAAPPNCFGLIATIVATGGVTNGTNGPDVIVGSNGDDTINGKGGNDYICDDEGNNVIHGNNGNDHIDAVGLLYGDAGDDEILSGSQELALGLSSTTKVYGGTGADDIDVGEGIALIDGGAGDDTLEAGVVEQANGNSGNDLMFIAKALTVDSGSGSDQVNVVSARLVDCGSGSDSYDVFLADTIRRCETDLESV